MSIKCRLIFPVEYISENGEINEFLIEKCFDFVMRPIVGDEIAVLGISAFTIRNIEYNLDSNEVEVSLNHGPGLDDVQRWINNGFTYRNTCSGFPKWIVWKFPPIK